MTRVLLVGNPNCGKTTLFNALTGENQRIGNWPGVTVEKKTGTFHAGQDLIELTDLPGIYSLSASTQGASKDEQIAAAAIADLEADWIINVIDACHLERHLYLTTQILELGKPVIIVLTMVDRAKSQGIKINYQKLGEILGCPIIPVQAHKNLDLDRLLQALSVQNPVPGSWRLNCSVPLSSLLARLEEALAKKGMSAVVAHYYACRSVEGHQEYVDEALQTLIHNWQVEGMSADILLADARYQHIHQIVASVQLKQSDASELFTARVDRFVLHRFWAFPIFLGVMYLMFFFAINVGGAFQDFFDISTDTLFVQGFAWGLQQIHSPTWLIAILANGLGKGINTVLTFIPVIASLYFFLALLETSGYMARAAFIVDKLMRILGLPGKSFVPLIVGFGCNVPAIMAARTLDSERDRLLTILMSPFMSCSARLAIYTVFVAAFFPHGGQNIVFSLYLIGILMAVLTGFLLRKMFLKGDAAPLILELPAYHRPSLRRLVKETTFRLRFFVMRAGKIILPVCVILGALNSITAEGVLNFSAGNPQTLLSTFGQWLTPVFTPMGIHMDNWPATVGLITGMLAKEVVIGTLNSLYAQSTNITVVATHFDLWAGLSAAFNSISQNLSDLTHALWNPVLASADEGAISQPVYAIMTQRFDGAIGAYAYLLFILLYTPCVSTMAVIRQEAGSRWMWLSLGWSLGIAYTIAVLFYQIASRIPEIDWRFFLITAFCLLLTPVIIYTVTKLRGGKHVIADS